jgi:hypothetical protein
MLVVLLCNCILLATSPDNLPLVLSCSAAADSSSRDLVFAAAFFERVA